MGEEEEAVGVVADLVDGCGGHEGQGPEGENTKGHNRCLETLHKDPGLDEEVEVEYDVETYECVDDDS